MSSTRKKNEASEQTSFLLPVKLSEFVPRFEPLIMDLHQWCNHIVRTLLATNSAAFTALNRVLIGRKRNAVFKMFSLC